MKIRILSPRHRVDFHDILEPQLWQNEELVPEVHAALLKIVKEFFDFLDVSVEIEDVRFTGSLANYNYSEFSDIDLHIVVDFSEVGLETKLVKEFFDSKRIVWNQKHNIKIKDYEVEVYVENVGEKHFSTGIYSLTDNVWLVKPETTRPEIDLSGAVKKASSLMKEIDAAIESSQKFADLKRIKEKIKKMRNCGLSHEGEFSVENLAFKFLRRNGYLKKLGEAYIEEYDKIYSLPEVKIRT